MYDNRCDGSVYYTEIRDIAGESMSGLLNYSTSIDVNKTLSEIQKILVSHGATQILYDFDNGRTIGLRFKINTPEGVVGVKLPANIDPVYEVLKVQKSKRRITVKVDYEQAERVAWRIIKDWIAGQMAFLETKMVKTDQLLLAFLLTNDGQTTMFEFYEMNRQRLLGTGK